MCIIAHSRFLHWIAKAPGSAGGKTYVQRPEATQEGEYVTAINCLKETALRQMILVPSRFMRKFICRLRQT